MTETPKTDHRLDWLENGTPVSTRFDDSYYSRTDGREETRAVFLSGNGLPERWQNARTFTIAELGFGTGLNFFETVFQLQKSGPPVPALEYVSFEQFPIASGDLMKAAGRWGELVPLAEELCRFWPPKPGLNIMEIAGVKLTLFAGDARDLVTGWDGKADAWYLDGFSPAKNPELWDGDLLAQVYNHTKPQGTFSTYTSAGWVRRNLQNAGFTVSKVRGFQHKKDRLQGTRDTE